MYRPGDQLIFRLTKYGLSPGPRAKLVSPCDHGDYYSYVVDKYWVVAQTLPDGKVLAQTRRGKTRILDADDPNLRRANWIERFFLRHRFPRLTEAPQLGAD